jgi:phenylalanyl-tRNA synthetase beta chain
MLGELHPVWVDRYDLGSAPVVFELDLQTVLQTSVPAYREISRQPIVARDLALIVDQSVCVDAVLRLLRDSAPEIVRSVELFDLYQGKGVDPDKKSLAFRILMQDTHRTLEDAEVEAAVATLVRRVESELGARLRG